MAHKCSKACKHAPQGALRLRIPARPDRAGGPEQSAPPNQKGNTMNKAQLIDAVATATGRSKTDVAAIISATLDTVQEAVASGDTVQIIGFGTWERRFREARTAPNPRGGAPVSVAAKHVPAFKAGAGFKQAVSA